MANYSHGVYVSETATSLIPTTEVASAIPFVVGIAPVNLVDDPKVNVPVLINSYAEAVQYFGYEAAVADSSGYKKFNYDISEFMYANFNLYGIVPCIFVNVLDPTKHRTAITTTSAAIGDDRTITVAERGIIASTLKLTSDAGAVLGASDYSTAFDDDGYLVITILNPTYTGNISIAGYKLDPSAVDSADIIGGVDAATGAKKGLELINDVFPKFGLIPTLVLCPKFSHDPEVAAIMSAKAVIINGNFKAMALIDAPTDTVKVYSDVPSWKKGNSITSTQEIVCWPRVVNGTTMYHSSVQLAGVIGKTDGDYGGVPYASPSNKDISISGLVLEDGTEVVYGIEEANYLNGQGILTFLNFSNGWTVWGNRTGCYPGNTDPKDAFIPVRRMFQWVSNTIITTIWQKVDEPGNRRLIDSIVDSLNVWLNSLTARQQLLGGRIEFREEDNSTTELMDGIYHFKVYMTPPSPAEDIEFDLEIDTDYYSTLFS